MSPVRCLRPVQCGVLPMDRLVESVGAWGWRSWDRWLDSSVANLVSLCFKTICSMGTKRTLGQVWGI